MSPCADFVRELWRRIRLEFIVEVTFLRVLALRTAAPAAYPTPAVHLCQPSILMEPCLQLPLLRDRWKLILFGACFQYVHGIATQLAHRLHQPANQPLGDLGFTVLPVGYQMT